MNSIKTVEVNYVRENLLFRAYANREAMPNSEFILWDGIFQIMNRNASGSSFPAGFIRIPNATLLAVARLSWNTFTKARKALIARGLIDYIPGKRNKEAPYYRMNYISLGTYEPVSLLGVDYIPPDEEEIDDDFQQENDTDLEESFPQFVDNSVEKPVDNSELPNSDEEKTNVANKVVFKNDAKNEYRFKRKSQTNVDESLLYTGHDRGNPSGDDCDGDVQYSEGRDNPQEFIMGEFSRRFNRRPNVTEMNSIYSSCLQYGMDAEMLSIALEQAALNSASAPAKYVGGIFSDWDNALVTTPDEAREYIAIHDRKGPARSEDSQKLREIEARNRRFNRRYREQYGRDRLADAIKSGRMAGGQGLGSYLEPPTKRRSQLVDEGIICSNLAGKT